MVSVGCPSLCSPGLTLSPCSSTPLYRLMTNYLTFVVGEVLLLVLTICSLAAIFPRVSAECSLE